MKRYLALGTLVLACLLFFRLPADAQQCFNRTALDAHMAKNLQAKPISVVTDAPLFLAEFGRQLNGSPLTGTADTIVVYDSPHAKGKYLLVGFAKGCFTGEDGAISQELYGEVTKMMTARIRQQT